MIIFEPMDRCLFLGCHLDDIEYGCGGLVGYLAQAGHSIHLHTLSKSNKNASGEIQLERNLLETEKAMCELGVKDKEYSIGNCFGQIFDHSYQQIREELLALKRTFQPTHVFFPSMNDTHQDHKALAENAFRIFRDVSCFGYEVIRSSYTFSPQMYLEISCSNLEKKIKAIMSYQSQIKQSAGYYFDERIIESIARFRGGQCGYELAEAFECYRLSTRITQC